jgi:hypothetical protein
VIDDLWPISLNDIATIAELQTRRDRKYVVHPALVDQLIGDLRPGVRALEIEGRRDFGYESLYFDTPDLTSYRSAAHRRRLRFKVRHRLYVDDGSAMLEVKVRDGRGRTCKLRRPAESTDAHLLTDGGQAFVDGVVGAGTADGLVPMLTTRYRRATLVDPTGPARLTIDRTVTCTDRSDATVSVAGVVLETKTSGPPSRFDRWLWTHGIRPVRLSKYCTGLAALRPELPSNKWHRTLHRHMV